MDDELSFYRVAVADPIDLMKKWLVKSASSEEINDDKKGYVSTLLHNPQSTAT